MSSTLSPRIYVACLASYNAGTLHGEWIDAAQDQDAIHEEIKAMLAASPEPGAEEFAIHDHEDFGGFEVGEFMSIDEVSKLALALEEHGEAFALYANDVGLDSALEHFEEAYRGAWKSEADFAEKWAENMGDIPTWLQGYVDWEKFARDLFIDGFSAEQGQDGMVHVFDRNV